MRRQKSATALRQTLSRAGEVRSQEKSWKQIVFILASGFWLLTPVYAQGPAMTAVRDTVYKSDGSLASGTVVITWRPFVTADNKPVFGGTKTVPLSNGALAVALVPNAGGTPSGTSYNVKYYQSGNVFSEETWVVPSSSALPSPGAPTVSNVGTPGSTTYYYWVSAKNANGETLLGPSGVTTTSNSTLDGANYNQISWSAVSGATSYRVWRTATSTAPSGTGNYLVGETAVTTLDDQSNSLQQATVPALNDTDPRVLADVRVTAAPSSSVTLAASQVNGTAIVSNPSATQTINAPPKAGVIPLQIKGNANDGASVFEIYDSQNQPVLQSRFSSSGAFITAPAPTFSAMSSGSILFAGTGGLLSQNNANLFWDNTNTRLLVGPSQASFVAPNPQGYIGTFQNYFLTLNKPNQAFGALSQDNTSNQIGGVFGGAFANHTSPTTKAGISGGDFETYNLTTGTVTTQAGIYTYNENSSTGTVGSLIGILVDSSYNPSGTVSSNYGLKVENQTVGVNNWAIKTGTGKVQFGDAVLAPTINNVRYADQFSGANAGAKIAAAIADLPSTGGTVDARGFEGTQTISQNVFSGVTKPVTLLFGCGTFQVSAKQNIQTAKVKIYSEPCTTFQAAGSLDAFIQTTATDTEIHGGVFDANSIAPYGIQVGAGADRSLIETVEIKNTNSGGYETAILANGVGTTTVKNSYLHDVGNGIAVEGAASRLIALENRIKDVRGQGIRCIDALYCEAAGNIIENPTNIGIYAIFSDEMNVHDNYLIGGGAFYIHMDTIGRGQVKGNVSKNAGSVAIFAESSPFVETVGNMTVNDGGGGIVVGTNSGTYTPSQ
ncbi:MAG: right-handed parallel beta-helix repeat-containing protein, partial [Acidobacteria bacterium]|nr:right-handed parallel beta-helix repeat-containing protein [Acidobacteriota bacterium]